MCPVLGSQDKRLVDEDDDGNDDDDDDVRVFSGPWNITSSWDHPNYFPGSPTTFFL